MNITTTSTDVLAEHILCFTSIKPATYTRLGFQRTTITLSRGIQKNETLQLLSYTQSDGRLLQSARVHVTGFTPPKYKLVSWHIRSFIHSSCFMYYDRSTACSKASYTHTVRSSAFKIHHHFFPLSTSSSCLLFLPRLPVTCLLPSIYPSATCSECSSYITCDQYS